MFTVYTAYVIQLEWRDFDTTQENTYDNREKRVL